MPKHRKREGHRDPKAVQENRVYLFESLARGFLEQSSALLVSDREHDRRKALRALADLAYVSCVVADGERLSPEEIRDAVAAGAEDKVSR